MSARASALAVLLAACDPRPATTAVPDAAPAPAARVEPPAIAPLDAWAWLDAPAQVLAVEGPAMVATGADLLREQADALVHDGLVADVPGCTTAEPLGDVAIAGRFPERALMVRSGTDGRHRRYRWARDRWHELGATSGARPLLATVAGAPVLLVRVERGYVIEAPLDRDRSVPTPTRDETGACASVLAEPHGAVGSAQGDLVVWGTGCDGSTAIEWFPADRSPPRITRWPGAELVAIDLDPHGKLVVARTGGDTTEILVANAAGWRPLPTAPPGRVRALLDAGDVGLFAVLEPADRPAFLALLRDGWHERAIAGTPRALTRATDGSLWIGTDTQLLRTRAPAFAATLDPRGCAIATLRDAQPYRPRDRRPKGWRCEGGAFVPIATTRGEVPSSWRALWPALAGEIELGFASARRRRGEGDALPAPGTPIEPVVARELDAVTFGFAVHGDDELRELALSELAGHLQRLRLPPPHAVCAAPPGLPEPEVRRLAQP